jgi:hypothetical protein
MGKDKRWLTSCWRFCVGFDPSCWRFLLFIAGSTWAVCCRLYVGCTICFLFVAGSTWAVRYFFLFVAGSPWAVRNVYCFVAGSTWAVRYVYYLLQVLRGLYSMFIVFCRFYVGCDICSNWFHGSCVGITQKMSKKLNE